MTLSEKFKTSTDFVNYVENAFGLALMDSKVKAFYDANKTMRFTYTGIVKAIEKL